MSAIWGIVDLSVAQSEAQRKNRAGNLWEEALRMRQAYRTSCLDRIQEKREATYYLACGVWRYPGSAQPSGRGNSV